MPKSIRIAVVQMDASPSPVGERLRRAENFVTQCAQHGAQLIVLPEVFNTGYEYSDRNYLQAETFDGPTTTWMKKTAADHHVHLAGSFLRREQDHIFNTLLLVSPDGRQWHYDKNHPWIWERAYFEKGTNLTVADTELGKIGFLICWDVAHPKLWQGYAGKIELMVISSCPPKALDLSFVFPDGTRVMSKNAGAAVPKYQAYSGPDVRRIPAQAVRLSGSAGGAGNQHRDIHFVDPKAEGIPGNVLAAPSTIMEISISIRPRPHGS